MGEGRRPRLARVSASKNSSSTSSTAPRREPRDLRRAARRHDRGVPQGRRADRDGSCVPGRGRTQRDEGHPSGRGRRRGPGPGTGPRSRRAPICRWSPICSRAPPKLARDRAHPRLGLRAPAPASGVDGARCPAPRPTLISASSARFWMAGPSPARAVERPGPAPEVRPDACPPVPAQPRAAVAMVQVHRLRARARAGDRSGHGGGDQPLQRRRTGSPSPSPRTSTPPSSRPSRSRRTSRKSPSRSLQGVQRARRSAGGSRASPSASGVVTVIRSRSSIGVGSPAGVPGALGLIAGPMAVYGEGRWAGLGSSPRRRRPGLLLVVLMESLRPLLSPSVAVLAIARNVVMEATRMRVDRLHRHAHVRAGPRSPACSTPARRCASASELPAVRRRRHVLDHRDARRVPVGRDGRLRATRDKIIWQTMTAGGGGSTCSAKWLGVVRRRGAPGGLQRGRVPVHRVSASATGAGRDGGVCPEDRGRVPDRGPIDPGVAGADGASEHQARLHDRRRQGDRRGDAGRVQAALKADRTSSSPTRSPRVSANRSGARGPGPASRRSSPTAGVSSSSRA